eukprot:CAMPEP_0114493738 /NCGR_PEP_ID=MMETSP0109-20121206/4267_1 /TAXON_ID=29199 /ORGANISM="Chlorarachnion reptans, Strain CCCM449" /LENGTH=548 /DNA_ID=CAMNT_0001670705 /DNA_START=93 /DNA_END=1739 /DNA_ORIENTATION=-
MAASATGGGSLGFDLGSSDGRDATSSLAWLKLARFGAVAVASLSAMTALAWKVYNRLSALEDGREEMQGQLQRLAGELNATKSILTETLRRPILSKGEGLSSLDFKQPRSGLVSSNSISAGLGALGTRVWKLVLTGGPCAGKSTALARVKNFLQNHGFFVATVSEAATFLHNNGIHFYPKEALMFQHAVTSTQRDHETRIFRFCCAMARSENCPAVMLCDRGLQDGRSYCSEEEWMSVLKHVGLPQNEDEIRKRYDAVFHMVTAANGAEEFYTKMENGKQVRYEEPAQAIELDMKLQNAWRGHPRHYILKNKGTFEDKLKSIISLMCSLLGIPQTKKRPVKFTLKRMPTVFPAHGLDNMSRSIFEKTYIKLPPESNMDKKNEVEPLMMFVRARIQQTIGRAPAESTLGIKSFILKCTKMEGSQKIESTRNLSRREYEEYLRFADPVRMTVRQDRIQFTYENQFYEIVEYLEPRRNPPLLLLNVYVGEDTKKKLGVPDVPKFLEVDENVTESPYYSAHTLSQKPTGDSSPQKPTGDSSQTLDLLRSATV